jgi:aminopeptidase-like protein
MTQTQDVATQAQRSELELLLDLPLLGKQMYELITHLYPICRSITGNGVRETLRLMQDQIPLEIKEVPSGTKVFDWDVPVICMSSITARRFIKQ